MANAKDLIVCGPTRLIGEVNGGLFNAAEKVYNQGSTAAINLSNGRIFYCTGSSITLPSVVDGVCITCIVTASSVTWGPTGSIRWKGGSAPTLTSNYDVVTFIGYSGYWYGG